MADTNTEFCADSVISLYGDIVLGEEVVYYKSVNPRGLLICFSAMDAKNKFNRLSWFWDAKQRWEDGWSVLFVTDRSYMYYIGSDSNPKFHTYEKIIHHFSDSSGIGRNNIFCVGSSMGGYAAILYAFRLRLGGAITGVPQVSKKFARMHNYSNWIKSINSTGSQWLELDEYLYRTDYSLPKLYLEYGVYPADCFAAETLLDIYRDRGGLVLANKGSANEHSYFMDPETIKAVADYFSRIAPLG